MKKNIKIDYYVIFVILYVLVAFHFMWFDAYSMKWDMAEQYLPWRFFISKALNNDVLPFWNPYQLGGYPTFADPQSGVWFYPTWIISILAGYSMSIIQIEITIALIFGSIGFYKLAQRLNFNNAIASILAISYISSGFIVGNAQHLTWIYAAVFVPWLIYLYIDIRHELNIKSLLAFLILNYLFLSSSYPAFAIVLYYAIIIDQLILLIKHPEKIMFIKSRIILLILLIVTTIPISYSIISSTEYFSRGSGITLERALQHPFSINSALSFLFPFSSFKNADFFKTDLSMANGYFGVFGFVLLLFGCFRKLNKNEILLLSLSLLFLLIAFGEDTPIRTLLYKYLPGFDLFRFPSLFRLFFIITTLLFVGKTVEWIQLNNKWFRFRIVLLVILLISFATLLINRDEIAFINNLEKFSFKQHILFQLIIHVTLISILFIKKKFNYIFLLTLITIDLLISVQLNSFASMVLNVKSSEVDKLIENRDHTIETPSATPLYTHIDQAYEYRWPLNWNMNCYFGEIAVDGYNPFVLKTFNELSDSKLKESIWANPFYYVDDKNNSNIELKSFRINEIIFKINNTNTDTFTIAQNPYPGWHVYVNGEQQKIITHNISHQAVILNKGENEVVWKFSNNSINVIFIIHLTILISLIITYFLIYFQFINLHKIK